MIFNREPVSPSVVSAAWNGLTQLPRMAGAILTTAATKITGSARLRASAYRQIEAGKDGLSKSEFYNLPQRWAFVAGVLAIPAAIMAASVYGLLKDDAPAAAPVKVQKASEPTLK